MSRRVKQLIGVMALLAGLFIFTNQADAATKSVPKYTVTVQYKNGSKVLKTVKYVHSRNYVQKVQAPGGYVVKGKYYGYRLTSRAVQVVKFTSNKKITFNYRTGTTKEIVYDYGKLYYGWTGKQWTALQAIVQRESSWNKYAANYNTGCFGLFQLKRMSGWNGNFSNVASQARIGLNYIHQRYGTPVKAKAFQNVHGWY